MKDYAIHIICWVVTSCFIRGEYEKIIHVDDQPSFSNHVVEGIIHELLEGGG